MSKAVINDHDTIFRLAQQLRELQAEKGDAERILKEVNSEIAEMEMRLSEAMESHRGWLGVLVGVFKKRKGGGTGV